MRTTQHTRQDAEPKRKHGSGQRSQAERVHVEYQSQLYQLSMACEANVHQSKTCNLALSQDVEAVRFVRKPFRIRTSKKCATKPCKIRTYEIIGLKVL